MKLGWYVPYKLKTLLLQHKTCFHYQQHEGNLIKMFLKCGWKRKHKHGRKQTIMPSIDVFIKISGT